MDLRLRFPSDTNRSLWVTQMEDEGLVVEVFQSEDLIDTIQGAPEDLDRAREIALDLGAEVLT